MIVFFLTACFLRVSTYLFDYLNIHAIENLQKEAATTKELCSEYCKMTERHYSFSKSSFISLQQILKCK